MPDDGSMALHKEINRKWDVQANIDNIIEIIRRSTEQIRKSMSLPPRPSPDDNWECYDYLSPDPYLFKDLTDSKSYAIAALMARAQLLSLISKTFPLYSDTKTKKVDSEDAANLMMAAYKFGYADGVYSPTSDVEVLSPKAKRAEKYNRAGKTVLEGKRRKNSAFTQVLKYVIGLCHNEGREDLLIRGNIDEFMTFVQNRIKDNENEDKFLALRVAEVRTKSQGFIRMHEGYGRSGGKSMKDAYTYKRLTIQNALSTLRKKTS